MGKSQSNKAYKRFYNDDGSENLEAIAVHFLMFYARHESYKYRHIQINWKQWDVLYLIYIRNRGHRGVSLKDIRGAFRIFWMWQRKGKRTGGLNFHKDHPTERTMKYHLRKLLKNNLIEDVTRSHLWEDRLFAPTQQGRNLIRAYFRTIEKWKDFIYVDGETAEAVVG